MTLAPTFPKTAAVLGCALAAALLAALPAAAQVRPTAPPRDTVPSLPVRRDTLTVQPPAAPPADTVPADTVRRVSPRGAFIRSLVLPGWGQSAVGSPGRGSIYFALEAGSLWMVYKSQRKLEYARRRRDYLRAVGDLPEEQESGRVNAREEQLEDWITLSAFLLLFNAADAFVAAHLRDFDERIGVVRSPRGGADIGVTVPVGRRP